MLDDSSTPASGDDLPRPPAGRHAATRPAGPPVIQPVVPDQGATAPGEDAPAKTTRSRTTKAASTSADKPARTARGRAAKAPEPAAEAPGADVPAPPAQTAPAEALGTAATATTRGRRRTASAAPAPDEAEVAAPEPTPAEAVPEPATAVRTRATARARRGAAEPAEPTHAVAIDSSLVAAIEEATRPARGARRGTASSGAAEAAGQAPVDRGEVLAHLVEAIAEGVPAAPAATRSRRSRGAATAAAEPAEPSSSEEAAPAGPVTRRRTRGTAATAAAGPAEETDGAHDEDEDHDDDEAGEDHEGTGTRRRRRRGGRRRHKGTGAEAEAAHEAVTPAEPGEAAPDHEDEADEDADEPGHRRRRRRRRRGEDASGADDDPSDVVVRVREPRSRAGAGSGSGDEVSGIEGSTRLEAKRQRRKESRAQGRRAPILTESEFLARREAVDRVMVIRQREDFTQIAVLEDGVLVEHYVDRASAASLIGNIYLGKVQNVLPGMEAAFIDIGRGRNAVLYAGEVDWDSFGASGANHKVEEVFSSGQAVLVQVSKDPVGAKGARLTGHVSLPGRYVVYSPDAQLSGISRKLPDVERLRLKRILGDVIGENASVIVRTAAEGTSQDELVRDVDRLRAQWEVIGKKAAQGGAPQLLYSEPDLTLRIVRDLFTEDFKQLVVAGNNGPEDAYDSVEAYVRHVAPHLAERLVRWDAGQGDPFARYRVDEQIAKALERKVFLPSGGSLVIDRTEAMTVIDVNTGKFTGSGGSNLEETVTRNNLEAAEEIVRQLRLRDLGGIVVIDFIDMVLPGNRELLLRRLVECLGRDRTRHQVSEVTSLGLVQLTRKKIGTGLAEAFTETCATCGGRGYIRHEDPVDSQAPADGGERKVPQRRSSGSRRGGAK